GLVLGTPEYLSPEQAMGEHVLDARSDLYSLGAVAFFALTGRPPFMSRTVGQLLLAHLNEPPPLLHERRADVPADLAAVVGRCLEKEPRGRYQSAEDVDEALARCACQADWSAAHASAWWGRYETSPPGPGTAAATAASEKVPTASWERRD